MKGKKKDGWRCEILLCEGNWKERYYYGLKKKIRLWEDKVIGRKI